MESAASFGGIGKATDAVMSAKPSIILNKRAINDIVGRLPLKRGDSTSPPGKLCGAYLETVKTDATDEQAMKDMKDMKDPPWKI
jgi:hypothetical protein